MPSSSDTRFSSAVAQIAIVGTDAVLAARPATAVQLAHACQKLGFAVVVPASWGDELIATECARRSAELGAEPAVLCACPHVTSRLLAAGAELAPFFVSLVSPPVAAARYVRRLYGDTPVRITFIGACPGADDEAVDERLLPDDLLALLEDEGIALSRQPTVFDSVIPPDRRRFASLPGGAPSPDRLREQTPPRTLIEIDGGAYAAELAQHLLAGECVLADLAPRLGCSCSGAVTGVAARDARAMAAALDPMRAPGPVVELALGVDVRLALPAPAGATARHDAPASVGVPPRRDAGTDALMAPPLAPPRHNTPAPRTRLELRSAGRTKSPATGVPRFPTGTVPVTRTGEGRPLPRAYVAARRTPPGGRRRISGEHEPSPPLAEDDTPAFTTSDRAVPLHVSTEQTVLVPRFDDTAASRPKGPGTPRQSGGAPFVALVVAVGSGLLLFALVGRRTESTQTDEAAGAGPRAAAVSPVSVVPSDSVTGTNSSIRAQTRDHVVRMPAGRPPQRAAGARTPVSRAQRPRPADTASAALEAPAITPPAIVEPARVDPTRVDPVRAAPDSERAAVLREIERRKARVDSLARRMESLPGRQPRRR